MNRTKRHREGRQEVTLSDVARLAGVSPITASRALNNLSSVAPETAQRVRDAALSLAYVPNLLAGGLASRRSRLVTAVIPTTINPVFSEMIDALRRELLARHYQLMLGLSDYAASNEDDLLATIVSRRPDGIVLTGVGHSPALRRMLASVKIPVVETWDLAPDPIDMLVGFSNVDIGKAAARYLIAKGRLRPVLIVADDQRAQARRRGFETVAQEHGLAVDAVTLSTPTSYKKGREGLVRALAARPDVDSVFCTSDSLAIGVLFEAIARGIGVPERLAVMCFGNLNATAETVPPLTTVAVDGAMIGCETAKLLAARMDGEAPAHPRVLDVGFQIIARASA